VWACDARVASAGWAGLNHCAHQKNLSGLCNFAGLRDTDFTMSHYDFPTHFRAIYDRAVALYAKGQRGADTFFVEEEVTWLARNGLSAQNLYDYAEDHANSGEPGFERALSIESVRRDYFLHVQHASPSAVRLDPATMPAKTDAVRGIEWLPRLIPKTKAKLRGELPDSLMFCCGGDRKFFKAHDILPSEFMNFVWHHEHNDNAIVEWVAHRTTAKQ